MTLWLDSYLNNRKQTDSFLNESYSSIKTIVVYLKEAVLDHYHLLFFTNSLPLISDNTKCCPDDSTINMAKSTILGTRKVNRTESCNQWW